ncbi:sensor histidine kinase [Actinoallomurus acaciae]|uniref:histidine kinase n=1 Tax=Actinoallomurus acaciae TaxID=502577 RepID=A0ABV5Y8A6_9ACTN
MALLGVAAVVDLFMAGSSSPKARLVLVVIAAGAVVVLGAAIFGADTATRRERRGSGQSPAGTEAMQRRLGELGFVIARGRQDLQGLAERIAAGETVSPRNVDSWPDTNADPFVYLARELQRAQSEAWNAVIGAANQRNTGGSVQRVEVFVNLARRMQSLSHRAIQGLDELENQVEDPDLLKGLFRVDHLSTRMRRQAESLAVIGGAASRRQWSRPVTVYEVLRSAIAEVEHYSRVKVVPPVEGTLEGGAVADVIHLLAELVENATKFSPPHTQVLLRAESVTAGLAIEIDDRGLGIPRETQHRLNALLSNLERVEVDEYVKDGRIGLLVVSALSRRHNVVVRLQTNLYGGAQAVVVIPNELIGSEQQEPSARPETTPEPAEAVPALSASTAGVPSSSMPASGLAEGGPVLSGSDAPRARTGDPSGTRQTQGAVGSARQADGRTELSPPRGDGQRPELPRRRAQSNLAPELLNTPAPKDDEDDDADTGYNPGLMAAFQNGMRSGQEEDMTDRTGGGA